MIIKATFANRPHDPENSIELVTAWDEYSIDANPEGYAEDVKTSLASWGDDLLRHVTFDIEVPYLPIMKVLARDPKVDGVLAEAPR